MEEILNLFKRVVWDFVLVFIIFIPVYLKHSPLEDIKVAFKIGQFFIESIVTD